MTSHDKSSHRGQTDEPPHWIEKPETVNKISIALYIVCAFLLIIDIWIHKHGPFAIEYKWGFYLSLIHI